MSTLRLMAGLVLATIAVPAFAGDEITVSPAPHTRQVAVDAGDLNVANPRGRATLARRLEAAANEACSADALYTSEARSDVKRCRAEALANAWQQVAARQGDVAGVAGAN